jgi:hypothetical protein
MSYTWTIQVLDTSDMAWHARGYSHSIIDTVNVLTWGRKHNANASRGNAGRSELDIVHLDQNVETVETAN